MNCLERRDHRNPQRAAAVQKGREGTARSLESEAQRANDAPRSADGTRAVAHTPGVGKGSRPLDGRWLLAIWHDCEQTLFFRDQLTWSDTPLWHPALPLLKQLYWCVPAQGTSLQRTHRRKPRHPCWWPRSHQTRDRVPLDPDPLRDCRCEWARKHPHKSCTAELQKPESIKDWSNY